MGASKVEILRLLLWQFAKPVLWANVVAWPAAYFIMQRWLEGFAYHVDLAPWMFLAAVGTGAGDCGAHRHRPRAAGCARATGDGVAVRVVRSCVIRRRGAIAGIHASARKGRTAHAR